MDGAGEARKRTCRRPGRTRYRRPARPCRSRVSRRPAIGPGRSYRFRQELGQADIGVVGGQSQREGCVHSDATLQLDLGQPGRRLDPAEHFLDSPAAALAHRVAGMTCGMPVDGHAHGPCSRAWPAGRRLSYTAAPRDRWRCDAFRSSDPALRRKHGAHNDSAAGSVGATRRHPPTLRTSGTEARTPSAPSAAVSLATAAPAQWMADPAEADRAPLTPSSDRPTPRSLTPGSSATDDQVEPAPQDR